MEARIIEADPHAAQARRAAAAMDRFVTTGQTNEHGLKTLIAKANAGDVIMFVAVTDRIAQLLTLDGDTDPVDVRRSKALGYLANPALALALLHKHTTGERHPDDPDPDPDPDLPDAPQAPQSPQSPQSPQAPQAPAPAPVRSPAPTPPPGWSNRCVSCGGPRLDPDKLRPRGVLYVRVTQDALCCGVGVAHAESGIGPITLDAIKDLLGHHRVTVRPVLTLAGQAPVDAYEIPHDMREALRLARPSSVFPWTQTGTRTPDLDHTTAYLR